ncbi:methionyl-tRNA formyltransferase [Polaribacter aestuariivivens]|uniref:methionyl-tRNA formyltransferase n=1 Tax=Polaribacter aestuariivivens TaxID=2304626 RepID=UPI003F49257F
MKIALFLLNKRGYDCLNSLIQSKFYNQNLEFKVVLEQDKGNKEDFYSEMVNLCINNNICFYDRKNFKEKNIDYGIAIGWRRLIYNVNKLIVLHDSILPKYRGFSPLVNMLINGEKEIGVTALFANEEMDKGDLIFQSKIPVTYPIKIKEAIDIIAKLYKKIFINLIEKISIGENFNSFKQNENEATYSVWRDESDYRINWNDTAENIKRFIDAVGYPYSGAKTILENQIITINDVTLVEDLEFELIHAGKIIMMRNDKPIVICGRGALIINSSELDKVEYKYKKIRVKFQ